MRISFTLFHYLVKNYLYSFALVSSAVLSIITLINCFEILRRLQDRSVDLFTTLSLIFYKLPYLYENIAPFIIFLAVVVCLNKLNKNNELTIIRSFGISAWQFIFPLLSVVFLLGLIQICLINPISVAFLNKSDNKINQILKKESSVISISQDGFWLKDVVNKKIDKIIYARQINSKDNSLTDVSIFQWENNFNLIQAKNAKISNNLLILEKVTFLYPTKKMEKLENYVISTSLEPEQLQQHLLDPSNIPFWKLPAYINQIKAAGFSVIKYNVYFYNQLLIPFLFVSLALFSTAFALTMPRNSGRAGLLGVGVVLSMVIYFIHKVILTMGMNGTINEISASVSPILISLLLGVYLLLQFEEG